MAEYIERRELENVLNRIYGRLSGLRPDFYAGYMMAFSVMMKETRAADVAPVVHGRWNSMDGYKMRKVCSECGWDVPEYGKFYSYCPHCGAKMGGTE